GIFVTHDSGRTWQARFQHEPVSSIGALAVAPSNPRILYAGTGQAGLRSDMSFGDGMYRSDNGGHTWKWIGLRQSQHIAAISVDPRQANTLLVAVLGHAFGPNPERGVFLTTNGGRTWKKTLYVNPDLGAIDLTRDPTRPALVYAALWNFRFPFYGHYGVVNGPGAGIFRSENGGRTWQRLADRGLPRRDLGRIGIAIVAG
ncbi:BNR/Asp-box repeat domain protein, partial [mine drainage metagenome]